MAQVLGEVRIHHFLENIIQRFQLNQYTKEGFLYKFHCHDALCAIGYEKQSKLFSKHYNFTIMIEKEIATSNTKQEVRYSFRKNCWVSKHPNHLLQIANSQFLFDWDVIDFSSLKIIEEENKRIFKMTILPGSYTSLLFPPLKQGIDLYEEEIKKLKLLIDIVSSKLDYSL